MCSVHSNSTGLGPERVSAMLLKTSGELFTGVEVSLASLCWILLLLFGVLNKELADNWWTIALSGKPFTSGFLRTSGAFFAAGAFLQILLLVFDEPPKRQFSVKCLESLISLLKLNVEIVTWGTWIVGHLSLLNNLQKSETIALAFTEPRSDSEVWLQLHSYMRKNST